MANQQNQEADIGRLIQVRRDKLAELQAQGKDPFVIRKYDQTHHSSDVIDIYTKKEAEALAGRAEVNTDGMDEAQAKEAINNDYNERRAIMDAQHI